MAVKNIHKSIDFSNFDQIILTNLDKFKHMQLIQAEALNKDMGFTVGAINVLKRDIANQFGSINKSQKV